MYIPDKLTLNSRQISIVKSDMPFDIVEVKETNPITGKTEIKKKGLMGYYLPDDFEMGICLRPNNPSVAESLFFHELIEAIDVHNDFKLDHCAITTLGNNLHQAFLQLLEYNLQMNALGVSEGSTVVQ